MNEYKFPVHSPSAPPVILASASPRRRELLGGMGISFTVRVSEADENIPVGTPPVCAVELLARRKGEAVAAETEGDCLILAADTLVALGDRALGKPRDAEEAKEMLRTLSGKTHEVHTGVAVLRGGKIYSGAATTEVVFRTLTEEEIADYVATGEPLDKAGAYGIQGLGGALVARIAGEFDNVVGLPCRLADELLCRAIGEEV